MLTHDECGKKVSTGRSLTTPDEIMTGGEDNMFIKIDDHHPFFTGEKPYYEDPILNWTGNALNQKPCTISRV